MTEHVSLVLPKSSPVTDEEVSAVAKEFIEPFRQIAEARRSLKEKEEDLLAAITAITVKLDVLAELKQENMKLEREVLEKLKSQLPP